MDAQMKARWVKALRSGKYRQARGVLRTSDAEGQTFCCLGVLCEVNNRPDIRFTSDVRRAFELDAEDSGVLIEMNDNQEWDFEDIADYIAVML